MPTANAVTPIVNATIGPLNAGVQGSADVRVDGHDVSYVQITASQDPDTSDMHELRLNEATGGFVDVPSTEPVAIELTDVPKNGPHMLRTVYITSGKDATTFTVVGLL